MEVSQQLQVGAKEFFDALGTSVAYDVSQATGKDMKPDQLYSGYKYKKKMKNKIKQEGDVQVIIKQFVPSVCYEATFRSAQGTNTICYEIEDLKDGSIDVRYREGFEGESTTKSLNHKIMSSFYDRGAKKRMNKMLMSMEQYIIAQRNNS